MRQKLSSLWVTAEARVHSMLFSLLFFFFCVDVISRQATSYILVAGMMMMMIDWQTYHMFCLIMNIIVSQDS